MVTGLATLTELETLCVGFQSPTSRPNRIRLPPVTVLPALYQISFHGVREYLEVLDAQIDAPRLHLVYIEHFNQLSDFQVPKLFKFINRSEDPRLSLFDCAQVCFGSGWISFNLHNESGSIVCLL